MIAKIKIEMANAAFEEPASELARILRDLAKKIEDGQTDCALRDVNGNTVGRFFIL